MRRKVRTVEVLEIISQKLHYIKKETVCYFSFRKFNRKKREIIKCNESDERRKLCEKQK